MCVYTELGSGPASAVHLPPPASALHPPRPAASCRVLPHPAPSCRVLPRPAASCPVPPSRPPLCMIIPFTQGQPQKGRALFKSETEYREELC